MDDQTTAQAIAQAGAAAERTLHRQQEAAGRADRLLKSMLSPEQREQYEREQMFEIIKTHQAPGAITRQRRYRLKKGWASNIYVLDEQGAVIERLCIHPSVSVPEADNLIAQKLLLETNEEEFLRIANHYLFGVGRPGIIDGR